MSENLEKKFFLGSSNRMDEEVILKEYPHAIRGTMTFLQDENKQACQIECQYVKEDGTKCGCKRLVRTSDLFHTKFCDLHTIINRRAKAKARKAKKDGISISVPQALIEEAIKAVDTVVTTKTTETETTDEFALSVEDEMDDNSK